MHTTTAIVPQQIFDALGATLLHSLWQGAVLAALTGLVLPLSARASAARRYQLLICLLLMFCGVVIATFINHLPVSSVTGGKHIIITQPTIYQVGGNGNNQAMWQVIVSFVHQHNALIVSVWLAVVIFRAVQMTAGLRGIHRLKRTGLTLVTIQWTNRLAELAETIGITRVVQLAESALAKTPMVVGHFKPLILLPVGLLTALSADEVEAILAHELAHIRRKDYLVNLVISLVEILFFFNPAILWLSALIKDEREHCCDDIAVTVTASKTALIRALATCEEHQQSTQYALAFTGRGGLFARSTRLLLGAKPKFNRAEKSLVAVCLLGVLLVTTAFTHQQEIKQVAKRVVKAVKTEQPLPDEPVQETLAPDDAAAVAETATLSEADVTASPKDTTRKKTIVHRTDTVTNHTISFNQDKNINYNQNNQIHYNRDKNINHNKNRNADISVTLHPLAPVTVRLDSLHQLNRPRHKTGIAMADPAYRTDLVIKMVNGEENSNNDIADVLAKAIVKSGLTDNVKSFKMTATDLVLNEKQIPAADFNYFKEKQIKYFDNGTTVYYNFDTKNSRLHIKH